MKSVEVLFRDYVTRDNIATTYQTDWKFEVGEQFKDFLGYGEAIVREIELQPYFDVVSGMLNMLQIVYVAHTTSNI